MGYEKNDGWGEKREATKLERLVAIFLDSYGSVEGLPTRKVFEDFEEWQLEMKRKYKTYNYLVGGGYMAVTRTVNKLIFTESVRQSVNGRQISVYTKVGGEKIKPEPLTQSYKKRESRVYAMNFINQNHNQRKLIGKGTRETYKKYREWLYFHKPHVLPLVEIEFIKFAKKELKCDIKRKRVKGKQISVFWDENASRLDLGNYLDLGTYLD